MPIASPEPSNPPDADLQNRQTIARLEKSAIYQEYRQAFEATTGLPLGLRARGAFGAPLRSSKQANPFCRLMAGQNRSCAACLEVQSRVESGATKDPCTLECYAGLSETSVPLRVGDTIVGFLQTGQVALAKPSRQRFQRLLDQLEIWGTTVDQPALRAAYFQTRVFGRHQYASVVRLLSIFGEHLSGLTNEVAAMEQQSDSPVVARARAHIEANFAEALSLATVAQAVNLSEFYFCKLFKKETGFTFVEYLSRVRIQEVKRLLLDPHLRVSEAAFAAGFQSLSQFNRVFRSVAGQSPSSFRDHLHRHPLSAN